MILSESTCGMKVAKLYSIFTLCAYFDFSHRLVISRLSRWTGFVSLPDSESLVNMGGH